ncbi:hypothetical protein PYW08_011562 [Mythimna loreyi]|uniref:Uncharacterized protein n=1 Tax=Mythimna loreyi TaxID=667449 RepID=A0ACC2QK84_9NEOP|nr:hypothetical protein PYW08_011562 [Mythimna loreyi]
MDRITFYVNKEKCSVGSEVDSDTSLIDYIRNHLNLRGTKYMCKEGGCGACIVAVTLNDPEPRTFSVNSCLVSVTSCQDWEITTIEGIGDRSRGYHPVQKTLAEYDGSQCGYCSPGFVMSMYSLLESNHYDLTQYEIENSFGSNTCRCTGSRPILDAFKSFANDAPKPPPKVEDIEDLKICKGKEDCHNCDKHWCLVKHSDSEPPRIKKIDLKDGHVWYRVNEITDIFTILDAEGYESYMLVNGNTGKGAVPILANPRVLIDIKPIKDLKGHFIDQNLVVGAGITLTDLMKLFKTVSKAHEEFQYLYKLYEHLDLVAHIPVRNIGTVAGNLMTKHRLPTFSSDIFLLLETVGATLVILHKESPMEVTPEDFLSLDMTGRVITQVKIPPYSHRYQFVSFKIMSRAQNAHAQVNAAFLYEIDEHHEDVVLSARIVMGGLSAKFVHAKQTEKFLQMKKIFTNEILQQGLKILEGELIVEEIAGEMKPAYRKKCALGLFYKGLLALIPQQRLKPWYRSGARDFRKTRPLSKGSDVYDTNPVIWPITEPMPNINALIQCAGEAKYCNDLPTEPKEVYCAFVTSDICTGEIESIDPTPALKIPGVLAFFSAKDIPGKNSFLSQRAPTQLVPVEVFAEKNIKYYDQAIGVIVAETEKLANKAALLVKINYKVDKKKPVLTIKEARKREPERVTLFLVFPARSRGLNVQRILKGSDDIYGQYHFHMETHTTVTRPSEDGLDIYASTQAINSYLIGVSEALNLPQNRINITVPRCGSGYGAKINRGNHIGVTCALVTYLMHRPCRFVMSIQANMRVIGKRLPCTRDFEVGVSNSGEIQYLEYHFYEDNGYVACDPIINLALAGIKNCYDNRRWQYKMFNVTTDTATNTYARAPGSFVFTTNK